MAAVDFLHHENPPTWAGVELATLGADGQRQTNYATQSALAELADWKYTRIYNLQRRLRVLVERCRKDSSQAPLTLKLRRATIFTNTPTILSRNTLCNPLI
ncbi:hypothetical protein TNCV_2355681 [Trichonephila clavipes]|nr:hypothetical protein TNCV_2355681 [Trichonephila clavipes]